MMRLLWVLVLLGAAAAAQAQPFGPGIPVFGPGGVPGATATTGGCVSTPCVLNSADTFTGTGGTTAITIGDRAAFAINVRDQGAVGNGGQYTSTFAITSGLKVLTAVDPVFANAVPGMFIGVPNAGATGATGNATAVALTDGGDSYTAAPTVTLSGSPSEAATVGVVMGVKSATKTSGGTGCPTSTTITFNVATVTPIVPVTISMATDGSGNVTGSPTVLTGQWLGRFPLLTGNAAVGSACSVQPIFSFNIHVDHFCIGSTSCPQTGYGAGYALAGITASVSGGSPGTPATPGAVTITPYIQTLGTTIASKQSSTQVTLTAAATTTVGQSETVAYGTLDTAAFQAAVNQASLTNQAVYVPNSAGCYMIDEINLLNNTVLDGGGTLCQHPSSLNPMLNAGAHSHIKVQNLTGIGNLATVKSTSSGSAFLVATTGATDIKVLNTHIYQWTHHCISVDGIAGGDFSDNTIDTCWLGAGIILSSTVLSSAIVAHGNIVSNTQFAGVEAGFIGLLGSSLTDNQITNGGNYGNGDGTSGHVSDCMTGYTANAGNELTVVSGNTMVNCGNNGLHWGGNRVLIANNTIKNPYAACIFIGGSPNSAPPELFDNRIIGNHCTGRDKTDSITPNINVRNMKGGVIVGNTATNVYDGIELYGFAGDTGERDMTISGNSFNTVTIGIWLRHKAQYNIVGGNLIQAATVGIQLDNSAVGADTGFPAFFNTITTNSFDTVTTPISEINGANFNTFDYQTPNNGSGANNITGAGSVVQSPGGVLTAFSTSGSTTFAFPVNATTVCYEVVAGGSSGANGHAQASGTATSAGAGGSAGGVIPPGGGFKCVLASALSSPVTVVVGAGGASPAGDGAAGNVGTQSCFGTDCVGGGGAPSGGTAATNSASGASGSVVGVGNSASGATAGAITGAGYNIAGVAGATTGGTLALGGASGAGSGSAGVVGNTGGSTITGASGGGSGGGLAGVQVGTNGGKAGSVASTLGGSVGQVGVNNGDATAQTCAHTAAGLGGSGGASNVASRGGNGGPGCDGGGGGGGGSTGTGQTPGIGGNGGDGLVQAYWR